MLHQAGFETAWQTASLAKRHALAIPNVPFLNSYRIFIVLSFTACHRNYFYDFKIYFNESVIVVAASLDNCIKTSVENQRQSVTTGKENPIIGVSELM